MKDFMYMLAIMLICFKLSGIIDWNWFFVVLPAFYSVVAQLIARMVIGYHKGKDTRIGRRLREKGIY